jgi:hypothetical protein
MQMDFRDREIMFDREPSKLDEMAMYFSERLKSAGIGHVFVSGYVAILFGRNRASEDIDVITDRFSMERFLKLWKSLDDMECIITHEPEDAYSYLKEGMALRFSWKGEIIPNIEMKFASNYVQRKALSDRIIIHVNGNEIPISPIELQIAYKLFLGSEKDIEDARFLFDLFREHLDEEKLKEWMRSFRVYDDLNLRYLGWYE